MRAVQFDAFGTSDLLAVRDVPRPSAGPGEVLVRQVAGSVNPVDILIRSGAFPPVGAEMLPYTGGRDVAGRVERIGDGVAPDWLGRPVFGLPGFDRGAFAEHVILKISELAPAPRRIPLQRAGSVPLAALTAWQALHDHGGIAPGQRVLIQGASGGVGHFAVQLAKAAGATVAATASTRNLAFLEQIGADLAISYQTDRFEDHVRDVDLVIDAVGGETLRRSLAVVKPGGRLISITTAPEPEAVRRAGLSKGLFFIAEPLGAQLAGIAQLIDDGVIDVTVDRTFGLDDVGTAQDLLQRGGTPGKIGISVS